MNSKKIGTMAALFFAMVAVQHVGFADDNVRHYGVKQTEPNVGTSLTKEIVKAGIIPLNKPYADLTDQQKASLTDEYDHMPAGDEPPFPVKGLLPIYRAIATAHEKLGYADVGSFSATVQVDSEGHAKSVQVITAPNQDIADAATFAMMKVQYKPAVCSGQPCAMQLPIHAELLNPLDFTGISTGKSTAAQNSRTN